MCLLKLTMALGSIDRQKPWLGKRPYGRPGRRVFRLALINYVPQTHSKGRALLALTQHSNVDGVEIRTINDEHFEYVSLADDKVLGQVVRNPATHMWVAWAGTDRLGEWPLSDAAHEAVNERLRA